MGLSDCRRSRLADCAVTTEPPALPIVLCFAVNQMVNKLHFGDNLKILREYVADASVDLIYLDPPFNSNATGAAVAPTFRSAYASLALTFRSANAELKLGATKGGEESAARITPVGDIVAPLYERRLVLEEEPAVIDRRYRAPDRTSREEGSHESSD